MNRIFIEAEGKTTPEYNFLKAFVDLHPVFFDCFEDYEKCVTGVKDEHGLPLYNTPNLKGKLHTYKNAG